MLQTRNLAEPERPDQISAFKPPESIIRHFPLKSYFEVYGISEAGAISTHVIPEGDMSNSSGKPVEGVELKVCAFPV